MRNSIIAWILQSIKGIGLFSQNKLIENFGSLENIYKYYKEFRKEYKAEMEWELHRAFQDINEELWENKWNFYQEKGIEIISIDDIKYPYLLKLIPDAPLILYCQGQMPDNSYKHLSIIGTRLSSEYASRVLEKFIKEWRGLSLNIISGLAQGVDGIAHEEAIKNDLPTFAVLGHGLQTVFPAHHRKLAQNIIESGGGLITEFEWGVFPDRANFPLRNRIIAELSQAVLVVESPQKGGSMITAQLAFSYNRDVIALPGSIFQRNFSGNHLLIKNEMAHLVSEAQDILKVVGIKRMNNQPKSKQMPLYLELNEEEKMIIDTLHKRGRLHVDDLTHISKMNSSKLASVLLTLEMNGMIKTVPGKLYELL